MKKIQIFVQETKKIKNNKMNFNFFKLFFPIVVVDKNMKTFQKNWAEWGSNPVSRHLMTVCCKKTLYWRSQVRRLLSLAVRSQNRPIKQEKKSLQTKMKILSFIVVIYHENIWQTFQGIKIKTQMLETKRLQVT